MLVLSDLGCLDGQSGPWESLGRRLRIAGLSPVALMPCPERYWRREVTRWFLPFVWDQGRRYPRRVLQAPAKVFLDQAAARDGTERLLDLLSPALQLEPGLLRAARRLLPPGRLDVGCEAAAWRHPDLRPTVLGAV